MKPILQSLFPLVLACATAPAHAAVVFGDGSGNGVSISFSQSAVAMAQGSTTKSDNKTDQRTITTLPSSPVVSSLSALASDTNGAFTYSASASGTLTMTFDGAAAASIRNVGTATATGIGLGDAYGSGGFGLSYSFTTTTADPFSLTYALSSRTLGCCGNAIQLVRTDVAGNILQRTLYGTDDQGTLTADLAAGTYFLTISKNEYPYYDAPRVTNGSQTATIAHDDLFTFRIGTLGVPAVPEPTTWATMIAGFGLVGGAMRRRGLRQPLAAT